MATKVAKVTPSTPEGQVESEVKVEEGKNELLLAHQSMLLEGGLTDRLDDMHAMKATADPDTLYYHEAMKEPDADKFKEAMLKEWVDQEANNNFSIIPISQVPEGKSILPAVWQMRRKREVSTGKIKKYKARMNLDGSRMKKGIDYELTYAPVVRWSSIRLALILSILNDWHTVQLDYVHAFPQAPVEKEIHMKIPAGIQLVDGNNKDFCLKMHRNIYGQRQAGRVWNKYLHRILVEELKFEQSKIDECVYYRGGLIYLLYTDDSILASKDKSEIEVAIQDIERAGLKITIEGSLKDFLGVNISAREGGEVHMTQPQLAKQIYEMMGFKENTKPRSIPAPSSKILHRHADSHPHDGSFDYRSAVGKINYYEKCTRPDISYQAHQCSRFVTDPRVEHGTAMRWLARYIHGTADKGIIYKPDQRRGLEVFVDSDFAGNFDKNDLDNPDTARSRHGYILTYAGLPIVWKSQLQTEIALSTTEAEYIGLSNSLREAIPVMNLLKEMNEKGIDVNVTKPKVHIKVFEDNAGAIEIAKEKKYRPRTKHLNVKLHHFRYYVDVTREITIHKIDTKSQPADMLTKPLPEPEFVAHRHTVMGW